jgi:hypothetical protein
LTIPNGEEPVMAIKAVLTWFNAQSFGVLFKTTVPCHGWMFKKYPKKGVF